MVLNSLLDNYEKYLKITKNPDKDYADLLNNYYTTPSLLLPTIYFLQSNPIFKKKFNDNTPDYVSKIMQPKNNDKLLPLLTLNLKYADKEKIQILSSLDAKIRQLLFSYERGHIEYGGVGVFPYITGEILSNVEQHSGANKVYTYSQRYPNEGYIDVGILDDGITIPGKFEQSKPDFDDKDVNPYEFKNDCEAIYKALNGISTKEGFKRSIKEIESEKDIYSNDNIGYGLNTSVRLITGGLGGSFLIASRGSICYLTRNKTKFIKVKDNNIFNGTFVCIRFKNFKLENNEFMDIIENHYPIKVSSDKKGF